MLQQAALRLAALASALLLVTSIYANSSPASADDDHTVGDARFLRSGRDIDAEDALDGRVDPARTRLRAVWIDGREVVRTEP